VRIELTCPAWEDRHIDRQKPPEPLGRSQLTTIPDAVQVDAKGINEMPGIASVSMGRHYQSTTRFAGRRMRVKKERRAVATRSDKLAVNYPSSVHWAMM